MSLTNAARRRAGAAVAVLAVYVVWCGVQLFMGPRR